MHFRAIPVGMVLLIGTAISAAGDSTPWEKKFGGGRNEGIVSIVALPDSGYIAAGMTESKGAGGKDLWVLRFDATGNTAWDKTFGGPQDDGPMQKPLVVLPDGGFALAGMTESKGAGDSDVWVVKLDRNGDVVWDKAFGGAGEDFAAALTLMPDGGLAVVGYNGSRGAGAIYAWVLRLDADGRLLWEKEFPAQATPQGKILPALYDIAALADGGLVLAGQTKSESGEDVDALVVRLDAKGDVVWDKTYSGPHDEEASSIVVLPDGGFAAAGGSTDGKNKAGLAWRLDRDGGLLWEKSFGGPRGWVFGAKSLADGGLALAGVVATSVGEEKGASVWRLDRDGRLLWQQLIDAPNGGVATTIDALPDGRLLVGGVTSNNGSPDAAIVTLPATPLAAAEGQAGAAPRADEKCVKYVPSVGKTVPVPCEQSPAPGAEQSALAAPAPPPAAATSPAPPTSDRTAELDPARSSQLVFSGEAATLDATLQKLAAWVVVKRNFPDWYEEQVRQASKLSAEQAVTKRLVEALVALRRQHGNAALAAGANRLKDIASASLNNVKALGVRSAGACHAFIAEGEASPAMLEILHSPTEGTSLQAQLAAVFEAIADGRKAPVVHDKAASPDYDALVAELTKLGWKGNDLDVFTNPNLLAREPPARMCQMMQDWFAAHLAITDRGIQERLLAETLKAVVSG